MFSKQQNFGVDTSVYGNLGSDIPSYMRRADGGGVIGGKSYLIGEMGAEIFIPKTSGMIIPNHEIGRKNETVINFNVTATDAQSFDNQIGMRKDMIVGMIDEAFHRRGVVGING